MNKSDDKKLFNDLVKMANEIADKLGVKEYKEDYYTDWHCGNKYKYGSLTIYKSYENANYGSISISIYDEYVLLCNSNKKAIYYLDTKWPELIEKIYKQIPNILHQRKLEYEKEEKRKDEFVELFKYFIYYGSSDLDNKKLAECDIEVKTLKKYHTIYNRCTGEDEYIPYNVNGIYYKGELVTEYYFTNDEDLIRNVFSKTYKPGIWTSYFKKAMLELVPVKKKIKKQNLINKINEIDNDLDFDFDFDFDKPKKR